MAKRLLIITTSFYPQKGGLETYAEEVGARLAGGSDYEVHILCLGGDRSEEETYRGMRIHRVPRLFTIGSVFAVPRPMAWVRMVRSLSIQDFSLVTTHTRFFLTSYLGMRLSRRYGIAHLHTEHGASPVVHPNIIIRLASALFDNTLGRSVLRAAGVTVAISLPGVAFCKKMGARRVVYVPNGIDASFWTPDDSLPSPEADRRTVVAVGRLTPAKGFEVLIGAFSRLPERYSLEIVGEGPSRTEIECQVASLGLTGRVFLRGQKERKEIRELLRKAWIFVNPSFNEGLPTVVLEALSVGVPTVATNVGGTSDLLKLAPGVTSLVPPRDIEALAAGIISVSDRFDHNDRQALHEAVAREYGWDRIVDRLGQLFKELL